MTHGVSTAPGGDRAEESATPSPMRPLAPLPIARSLAFSTSLVALTLAFAGCGREAPSTVAASAPSAAPAAVPATTPASLRLGEPISAPDAKLSDVAAHLADYKGKTFATTGTVTAVCQEMGCWMEIKDDSGQAHIRMHGHSFYVPKTSPGHHARIQATLVPSKEAESDCTEEASKQMGHPVAKLELDATGVEID
jgi:hypothetical protein